MSDRSSSKLNDYALVIDWETTGLNAEIHQGIEIAAAVVDRMSWKVLEVFQTYVFFDKDRYVWEDAAEKVHGISQVFLAGEGIAQEEARSEFVRFIRKYWTITDPVLQVSHNVPFDRGFTEQLLGGHEAAVKEITWYHYYLDTAQIGLALCGNAKSDVVFAEINRSKKRGYHSAVEDVHSCVYILQTVKEAWREYQLSR